MCPQVHMLSKKNEFEIHMIDVIKRNYFRNLRFFLKFSLVLLRLCYIILSSFIALFPIHFLFIRCLLGESAEMLYLFLCTFTIQRYYFGFFGYLFHVLSQHKTA